MKIFRIIETSVVNNVKSSETLDEVEDENGRIRQEKFDQSRHRDPVALARDVLARRKDGSSIAGTNIAAKNPDIDSLFAVVASRYPF